MRHLFFFLATVLITFATSLSAQSYQAALADLEIPDPMGNRNLKGLIWYPTEATEPASPDFESEVWVSTNVVRNAQPAGGTFPLVVLSHGMFGNSLNQAWLAGAMAKQGYVIAAIDHPGTSTWSRDPDQRRELWERPKDISRLIDFALTGGSLPAEVNPDRIFMAGHSLGGFTAAALAGARFDPARIDRFCRETPGELVCGIFSDWQIARTPEDRSKMQADLSDPRIRAFAIFDLGGTQSFSPDSLHKISRPMLIFGAPIMNSGLTLDIESRALVQTLPATNTAYVEPDTLSHFDFLGQCKPGGFELLAKEAPGDEIICSNGGAQRAAQHRMIIDEVINFFAKS
ncbi:alpha/beta fold hydrolase [uncultured Roseobacter sp.]|uniref:alpha/beta hydrolase family protein n=1 Tax=uncultured Roseobacter sp. TaxID=114847 RepID=UPI0026152362|nr:alpha/beta fold hydrolase [uncultured Roseobacter sp.]